jgi:hypothetical protein
MIADVGSPALKLLLDTFHMNIEEKDPAAASARPAGGWRLSTPAAATGARRAAIILTARHRPSAQGYHYQGDILIESFTPDVRSSPARPRSGAKSSLRRRIASKGSNPAQAVWPRPDDDWQGEARPEINCGPSSRVTGIQSPVLDMSIRFLALVIVVAASWGNLRPLLGQAGSPRTPGRTRTGFESLFNGPRPHGWDGQPGLWSVEDGAIVGLTSAEAPIKVNTFLIWTNGTVGDFELRCSYRVRPLSPAAAPTPAFSIAARAGCAQRVVGGYQADIEGAPTTRASCMRKG